jgi:putative FmdB family regulatory protein
MPLYEFRCRKCGERFERLVRTAEGEREVTCPRCREREVERLLSVFARRAPQCDPAPSGAG